MRILVVGDAMEDVYWSGDISRLNPEKHSAPLVSVQRKITRPGGAANVAANLRGLGAEVVEAFGAGKIKKNRVMDGNDVVCRFDEDEELFPASIPEGPFDGIIISDYGKGSVTPLLGLEVKKHPCPVFVDTKSHPAPWLDIATCMFPNTQEFSKHTFDYKCARLVLVKMGAGGAVFYRKGIRSSNFPSQAKSIVNPCGAGDTVIAAFVWLYCGLTGTPTDVLDKNKHQDMAARFAMEYVAKAVADPFTWSK